MSLSVCLRKETMKSLLVSARLARPETFAILRTKYFTLVGLSEWGDTGMSSLHKVEVCHGTYTFNKYLSSGLFCSGRPGGLEVVTSEIRHVPFDSFRRDLKTFLFSFC